MTGIGDQARRRVGSNSAHRTDFHAHVVPTISELARDFARTATVECLPGNAGGKVHTWTGAPSDPRIWKVPLWSRPTHAPRRNPLRLPYVGDDGPMVSVWVFEDTGEWGVVRPGLRPRRGDHDLAGLWTPRDGSPFEDAPRWPDTSPEHIREMFIRDLSRRITKRDQERHGRPIPKVDPKF